MEAAAAAAPAAPAAPVPAALCSSGGCRGALRWNADGAGRQDMQLGRGPAAPAILGAEAAEAAAEGTRRALRCPELEPDAVEGGVPPRRTERAEGLDVACCAMRWEHSARPAYRRREGTRRRWWQRLRWWLRRGCGDACWP